LSIEAQAINRINRIGQRKQTYVHRFVVQGSVEMKIMNSRRAVNGG
jgi:SNF2 family DNA or RNA helicase